MSRVLEPITSGPDMSNYKFTFVRNPFDRLYSCYMGKYHTAYGKGTDFYGEFDYYLLGYLKRDKGFENFVDKIFKIPDAWSDRHFKSQYFLIFGRQSTV